MKTFCIAGPVKQDKHYFIPDRLDEKVIRNLIEEQKYFIFHAPRQTGKTTAIQDFVRKLNREGIYKALYVNIEPAQAARNKVLEGMGSILKQLEFSGQEFLQSSDILFAIVENELKQITGSALSSVFQKWVRTSDKPIVLFIDEIDALVGDTLISVLRQLRAGYSGRPALFPQSVCLVGVRDVRDYRIWSEENQGIVLGGSAFNIKAESLVLHDFTQEQFKNLYEQHTAETGQKFTQEAIEYAFWLTQGQPWLSNALAYQACFRDSTDRSLPITKEIIENAKEVLIKRRDTHLDVLIDRLKEPRVQRIIDGIIAGGDTVPETDDDDLPYVRDLGLVKRDNMEIANPIYREVIPRALTKVREQGLLMKTAWYQKPDGSLDMHKLLVDFTQFFRENAEAWSGRFGYTESGPHLLLMAFLQRIINGGGTIHREYALGRRRIDLLVTWKQGQAVKRFVIETKVKRGDKTEEQGLRQTAEYMDANNATEGHLVIFDRTEGKTWEERISNHQARLEGRAIHVWLM